ncbi:MULTISPECIES: DUF1236 domain-containing protein [Rhodomicrobium]|uniref:DUF1236 domain-containing protein n=1 Tax=Rhodomicrobium TaxID=1068 RepID=UPI000B4A5CE7|nr:MULTISPECIES: DUF1236 domain-containing protein [Rhodomicrobium]
MSITIKGTVSAAALLIAVSAAQAQSDRMQNEGRQGGGQEQNNRGGESQPRGNAERGGDKQPDRGQSGDNRGGERAQQGGAEWPQQGGNDRAEQRGGDRPQQGQAQDKREDRSAQDKNGRDDRKGPAAQDRNDGPAQTGRQDRADGDGKRGKSRVSITAEQKPRFRDAMKRNTSIKRYHRSDVHFSINLGSRIPDTFVFYDAPSEFYDIDPDFRQYKVIVLDDVVLIVDPDTREIVDVIAI